MIIRSKFESNSSDKKKLTISNSRATIFKSKLQKSKNHQAENKQPAANHLVKNSLQTNPKQEHREFPSLGKQNLHKKKSFSLQKKQLYPEQKIKVHNIVSLLRCPKRQNTLPSLLAVDKKEPTGLRIDENSGFVNNGISIISLLQSSVKMTDNYKFSSDSLDETTFFELDKDKVFPKNNLERKKFSIRKSYYSQHGYKNQFIQNDELAHSNELDQGQRFNQSSKFSQKRNAFTLQSCLYKVVIKPFTSEGVKSVEVQTIQQEKQFFDYLRYKRKKNEFENDLKKAFETLDWVLQDRAVCEKRLSKFLGFDRTIPSNERQERIFKLTTEITKLQQKVESTILQKYLSFEDYVKEFQKIEQSFAKQNKNLLKLIHKYDENITAGLKPKQIQKLVGVLTRFQKVFKTHLKEGQKKVFEQILKGKVLNEESVHAIGVFQEYVKSMKEQKSLLKNCVGYIKKIPELCYGMLGDKLPNLVLRKDSDQIEMPKCMQCYNYEWKLHLIIEKNQMMQSIFKVTEELFK